MEKHLIPSRKTHWSWNNFVFTLVKRGALNHWERKFYSTNHIETMGQGFCETEDGSPFTLNPSGWHPMTHAHKCIHRGIHTHKHKHTQAKKSNCTCQEKKIIEYLITSREGHSVMSEILRKRKTDLMTWKY